MTVQSPIGDPAPRLRMEWASALSYAIGACHPDDAAQIMTAAMEDMEIGAPDQAFGPIKEDADWWADCATPAEIEAYTAAGLRQISRVAFGLAARKRLLVMLWNSLGAADKAAFLARVKGGDA